MNVMKIQQRFKWGLICFIFFESFTHSEFRFIWKVFRLFLMFAFAAIPHNYNFMLSKCNLSFSAPKITEKKICFSGLQSVKSNCNFSTRLSSKQIQIHVRRVRKQISNGKKGTKIVLTIVYKFACNLCPISWFTQLSPFPCCAIT